MLFRDPKAYYKLFGVSPDATPKEIRASYRRLAQKFHPDKYPSPNSTKLFQYLGMIYRILKDPIKRAEYDPWWDKLNNPKTTHYKTVHCRTARFRTVRYRTAQYRTAQCRTSQSRKANTTISHG